MSAAVGIHGAKQAPDTLSRRGRMSRWFKCAAHVVLVLAVLPGIGVAAAQAYDYLLSPVNFPLRSAKVSGHFQYLDRKAVQDAVLVHSRAGFFGVDIDALREVVLAMPWVTSVRIQRVWPDGIALLLSEHRAVARWNDNALLTEVGVVIDPPQLNEDRVNYLLWHEHFVSLPFLRGDDIGPELPWRRFVQANETLRGTGATLHGLHVDRRNAITLFLEDGTSVRLGRDWFDRRLYRLASVYAPHIEPHLGNISYIDLRYPDGFAVGWTTRMGDKNG